MAREQKLLSVDLNDGTKERVGSSEARAHPKADALIAAMAQGGWRVVQTAAGYGNWIYILFERP